MVPDTPDVEAVIEQIAPALGPGRLVIDMSTIAPAGAKRMRLGETGTKFLDAPFPEVSQALSKAR